METREKLAALRNLMKKNGADAYYVPSVDAHQSEYVPACWRRRAWLSGFTGSAGDVVVTMSKAALWTDGRYFLQASDQLADSGIDLMKMGQPGVPSLIEWTGAALRKGQVLGVDPRVLSVSAAGDFIDGFDAAGVEVRFIEQNLVDAIWADRPEPSTAPLRIHADRFAGEPVKDKLTRLRAWMKTIGVRAHVLGALDQIAWLFNIRSNDVDYNPLAVSYAVITERGATLYVDPRKVNARVRARLKGKVALRPYDAVGAGLADIARRGWSVLIDPDTVNQWVLEQLRGAPTVTGPSPVTAMKSASCCPRRSPAPRPPTCATAWRW